MSSNSSPLRVAFCLDSFAVGGTELNAVRTAESFDPARVQLEVFHLRNDGPLRSRYEKIGVPLTHLPIPNLRSFRTLSQGFRLAKLLRQRGIDVVHSHDIYCNIFAVPFARMLTSCNVIASRRWWYEAPRPELVTLNRFSNRFAHRVLGNSSGVAKLLIDAEGVGADRVVMIPNFLSPGAFNSIGADAQISQRALWGVPNGVVLIGIVARLSPVKNHQMLLKAIAMLPENIHLMVIGDGPTRGELEGLAAALNIVQRTHFAGEVVSQHNLHQYLDISVLCSTSEGFPNTVVEAMAAQRPVVTTPVGGIDDAIVDGVTGFVVPHEDVATLSQRLRALAADANLRARVGASACLAARQQFSQEIVVGRLTALYESISTSRRSVLPEPGHA